MRGFRWRSKCVGRYDFEKKFVGFACGRLEGRNRLVQEMQRLVNVFLSHSIVSAMSRCDIG